jgi:hypothetical protein
MDSSNKGSNKEPEIKNNTPANGNAGAGNSTPGNGNAGNSGGNGNGNAGNSGNGGGTPDNGNAGNGNSGNSGNLGNGNGQDKNLVTLLVIVNGTGTEVRANIHQFLQVVADKALEQTGNAARTDWQLKTFEGDPLDLTKRVGNYNFAEGTKLVLGPPAGVGGSVPCNQE